MCNNWLTMPVRREQITLRTFNNLLTVVVLLGAIYTVMMPIVPAISWWARHEAPLISHPATVANPPVRDQAVPNDNTVVIPNLGLQEIIHEGMSVHTLHFGVWHIPHTGSPPDGGNMVMAGHRYTYSGAGVFYHLDLVKTGDPIVLYWQHKRYNYIVAKTEVVPPTEMSVQAPSNNAHLTIYTCTPMWTFKNRLVIIANPVREAQS